nr:bifunctional folylpolyglutamate synthase/dihydrofolate synthase [Candidatus Omnitrophota bacterium]
MNYTKTIEYINSFVNFEKIPKYQYAASFNLERMNAILDKLGNPHKNLNVIHVAGSKGKGSTCAILAYILKEAGYKVGLYTSPHLVDFKERIRILDHRPQTKGHRTDMFEGMISEEEINEVVEGIMPVAEKFREHKILGKISFFEILTACTFLYFKKEQIDVAVLETGLGGRLDATNVTVPLVCGITNISLEHTDKLGDTLSRIAYEKAGIIKEQSLVVSVLQEKEAMDVIRKVCKEKKAKLYEVGKDIKCSIVNSNESGQIFDIESSWYSYKNLEIDLIGAHQIENASLSIGMLKAIEYKKFNIGEDDIREGLKRATWPGRLQIIQKKPYIILDGAQNPASMLALISSIKKIFRYKKLICVFGISGDKDIKGVSGILDTVSDIIILTKAKDNPRAEDVSRLKKHFLDSRPGLEDSSDIDEAMQKALKLANKEDLILVTGSLFIIGDAMQCFNNVTKLTL